MFWGWVLIGFVLWDVDKGIDVEENRGFRFFFFFLGKIQINPLKFAAIFNSTTNVSIFTIDPTRSFNFFQFRHFWLFFQNTLNNDFLESLCMVRRNHCSWHVGKKNYCLGHFGKKVLELKKKKNFGGVNCENWNISSRIENHCKLQGGHDPYFSLFFFFFMPI